LIEGLLLVLEFLKLSTDLTQSRIVGLGELVDEVLVLDSQSFYLCCERLFALTLIVRALALKEEHHNDDCRKADNP
jgi:hypothetical protein